MVVAKNKYQKFMAEKEKLIETISSNGSANSSGKFERKEFLPFFNPNKMFINKDQVIVRILPNKDGFYYEFKKHMFKIGETFKQFVCMYSYDENGKKLGETCPMCDFLESHSNELDKKIFWTLSSKNVYMIFVYNPYAKQIQKYETNDYGIVNITKALIDLLESGVEFDPDEEGFDIIFKKDEKGFAKVVEALAPDKSAKDIVNMATNTNEIKEFMEEIMPFAKSYILKQINATYQLAVNSFAPTFSSEEFLADINENNKEINKKEVNEIIDNSFGKDENIKTESFKTTKMTVDDEEDEEEIHDNENDEDDDEQVNDIKSFLRNRKR